MWGVCTDGRIVSRMDASPGNLSSLESWLGDSRTAALDDGSVISIRIVRDKGQRLMGVCSWDEASSTLSVLHVMEDDSFSNLETIIVATNAREALFCDSDSSEFEIAKLHDVLTKCGVASTSLKKRSFNPADVPSDLEKLVGSKHTISNFLDTQVVVSAISAVIDYIGLLRDSSREGNVRMKHLTTSAYMHLDNAAIRALNVLPYPGDGGHRASLFGLMKKTKSAMGSRLLRRWLAQPLQDIDAINERLDIVEAFLCNQRRREAILDDHINKLPDLSVLCSRFTKNQGAKASLQDVVRLYQCSIRLPFLCDELISDDRNPLLKERFSDPLRKLVSELANFEALVETTIDLEQIENGEFVLSPSVHPDLQELRDHQDNILGDIDTEYQKAMNSISGLKNDSLKLERKDNLGYIFRLTRKEEKFIRGKKQFIVLETRKDGVRFQSKGLQRLSSAYQDIASQYHERESEMRIKTLEVAGTYVEVFLDVSAIIAEVDVLCAFATVAAEGRGDYCRPEIKAAGSSLEIKGARHPIVEENMIDASVFVSNDINLTRGGNIDGESESAGSLLLVTGPNMGGKSTYIRTAGILTLMAHVGSFVPASQAEIPITDRIFARVGAGDNQHRAISTFMSEMLETAAILKSATPQSLVIIDELGRGTGTMDGYGLAYAISKHIASKIRCICLFATHFYELTSLENDVPSVRNVHVSAFTEPSSNKLTFLYEVQPGACDQSFGVNVAEMAHFPSAVVDAAKRKAAELEGFNAPSKRVKLAKVAEEDRERGQKLISNFLAEVKDLPSSTEAEAKTALVSARALRNKVLNEQNAYVNALLAES
ncbi:DNA mismatch repair protein Msh2 [Gracilaria domingensis]|nr:DNA mismatch repair protein Msh2 [Gracilaria domingensis]